MSQFSQFLLFLLGVFTLPFLLFLLLSFISFLVKEFLIEPLVSVMLWKEVKPKSNWATASGIVDSRVTLKKKRWYYLGKGGNKLWLKDGAPYLEIPIYFAHIEIVYLVDSKSYVIRPSLSFGDEFSSIFQDKAAALVAKYPSGKRIAVKYDPDNPQHATFGKAENVLS